MIASIELQVISKILTSESPTEVDTLCGYDSSYYSVFKKQIEFILEHRSKYGDVPDPFTFQAEFPDINLLVVKEPMTFLVNGIKNNKKQIMIIDTFNTIKDMGSDDVNEAWEYVMQQCERVQELAASKPLDLVHDAVLRSQQVKEFASQTRIPTGFSEIDKLMYGGLSTVEELCLILARTNTGKAQPLWSKVLTPAGWKRMGDIQLGDLVVGENNDVGHVVDIFPQGIKDYYKITFSDGTFAECCDDHLWKVLTSDRRSSSNAHYGEHLVLTTRELRSSLNKRYSIDITEPVEFDSEFDEQSELDGYLLGLILGDGSLRDNSVVLANESDEIWDQVESIIRKYGCKRSDRRRESIIGVKYGVNFVRDKLFEYGLMNVKSIDKFIPKQYLTAPVSVRKALLAGLVDTDGYCPNGYAAVWEFDTASEQLAIDFAELARSLGVIVKVHPRKPSHYINPQGVRVECAGSRHLVCRSKFNPFRLSTKAVRFNYHDTIKNGVKPKRFAKMIESIELVGQTECQCIMLDNVSHTYLTDNYTTTHNTWVLTKMMESAQKAGFNTLYYSPEMQGSYLGTRFDTWRGHFQNSQLFQGKYTEQYDNYIKELQASDGASAYVLEDKDVAENVVNVPVLEKYVKQLGIKLLIVDGLSYVDDVDKATSDSIKYKNICASLFKLSKQYSCAVVIAVQANRETRANIDDKGESMPNLYNIEGSDHPGRICTQAFALRQIFDKHVLDIRMEKARNANNQKPMFSYAWDVNTGNMQYLPGGEADSAAPSINIPTAPSGVSTHSISSDAKVIAESDDWDDDVEF